MIRKLSSLCWYWGPPILVMAIIFFMSSRQNIAVSETHIVNFIIFKTLHVCEYGLLTLLLFRALWGTVKNLSHTAKTQLAALMSLGYGISDEVHQTFVPTRSGALRDIGIDLMGIMIIVAILQSGWFKRIVKARGLY